MTEQQSVINTRKLKTKLLWVLIAVVVINILLLQLGTGLGGNYLKNYNSMLCLAPIGYVLYGVFFALFITFIPYKELSYKRKYMIASLFTSILINLFMMIVTLFIPG